MNYTHKKIVKAGKIFVVSAPSGGGKTTIVNAALEILEKDYSISKVITYTSRTPRINEVDGRDYIFISRQTFLKHIDQRFFLEWTEYNGQFYGSPASINTDLEQGKSLVLITDRDGAKSIQKLCKEPVLIWIIPPTLPILEQRLKLRKTESDEAVKARIKLAEKETAQEDLERIFKYHVVNNLFDEAVNEFCSIVRDELH